ncbi:MAG: DEAD/DEAH box helicase family protein, partial [Proteobacteria bacterium]|nr:DEAD/DEAH box helicase family protein [Pseudomonadota bacterium]
IGVGGLVTKARNNMAAIRLLKQIEAEGRPATDEEKAVLVQYVGWGGMPQAFQYDHDATQEENRKYGAIQDELRELLTDEEYGAARASTPNAHYTAVDVIRGIWSALERLGFAGGKVLEPGSGISLFRGLMPESVFGRSRYTAIERDSLSGRIAQMIHPESMIRIEPYEQTRLPDNYFDLAVSNVPFADVIPHDPTGRYSKFRFPLHDFFFAKSLDKVRPGGLVAFITSRYTMDRQKALFREYLSERADLVAAIRLPNTAFKKNANTEVTTDIIILKKREPGQAASPETWTDLDREFTGKDGAIIPVNEYYGRHPEMMLGTMALAGTMYRANEPTLVSDGRDLDQALAEAVKALPEKVMEPRKRGPARDLSIPDEIIPAPDDLKEGNLTVHEGRVMVKEEGHLKAANLPSRPTDAAARVKAMIPVRDAMRELLRSQYQDSTEGEIKAAMKGLNQAYDAFVEQFGPISKPENKNIFKEDTDYPRLLSLEDYDADTGTAKKEPIFTVRTIRKPAPVTYAADADSALKVSLNEKGVVDPGFMAELTGLSEAQVIQDLGDLVYKNPETDAWEDRDEYLSGNVRDKLAAAESAAGLDEAYARNVEALKAVQPKPLEAHEVTARLGSSWIDPATVAEFLGYLLEGPPSQMKVAYAAKLAEWKLDVPKPWQETVANIRKWGTGAKSAVELVSLALNQQTPVVKTWNRAAEKDVVDPVATAQALDKQNAIKAEFADWAWRDRARRERLLQTYNTRYNNLVERRSDGSHLTLPGSNPNIHLRPTQMDAVWRIIREGRALLHHVVGAGKTWTMVAAGMEMKRLGLISKPMYMVPNHMVDQFAKEFLELYPAANIMTIGPEDVAANRRKLTTSRIATGNWDAVIIRATTFGKIPVSPEMETKFIEAQIKDLEWAIQQAQDQAKSGGKAAKSIAKRLEKAKDRKRARLKDLANRKSKDDHIVFEELGVDMLFVDEAHEFKNLEFQTKVQVAGLGARQNVQKTLDLFMKVQYLQSLHGGRKGVVFATGTPISNSIAEMYLMQRYLMFKELVDLGLEHFDSWAGTFANATTQYEWSIDNTGYTQRTRFRSYVNVAELMQLYKVIADIVLADDLEGVKLPTIKGGRPDLVVIEPTDDLIALNQDLAQRLKEWRLDPFNESNKAGNPLAVTTMGRKAAIDMRLVDPSYGDNPKSKINQALGNIVRIWKEGKKGKLAQIVWLNEGTPGGSSTVNLYEDIKGKLVKQGIPAKEIAFIHDYPKDTDKAVLFKKVRQGVIRILIGSTKKMGTGMNVQKRLKAAHHLNPDWRPSDIEQRDGRIVRQGNENDEVEIYRYSTEMSFDTFFWQTLETKAGYIGQLLKAGREQRVIEEIDEVQASYAEAMAITSGDPLVKRKIEADAEAARLTNLRMAHARTYREMEDEVHSLRENKIPFAERRIKALSAAIEKRQDMSGDNFTITIGGKVYSKRKEANQALRALLEEGIIKKTETPYKIGEFAGFPLRLIFQNNITGVRLQLYARDAEMWVNNLESRENPVQDLWRVAKELDDNVRNYQELIPEHQKKIEDLKKELAKPWEQRAAYDKALEEQAEVNRLIEAKLGDKKIGETGLKISKEAWEDLWEQEMSEVPDGTPYEKPSPQKMLLPRDERGKSWSGGQYQKKTVYAEAHSGAIHLEAPSYPEFSYTKGALDGDPKTAETDLAPRIEKAVQGAQDRLFDPFGYTGDNVAVGGDYYAWGGDMVWRVPKVPYNYFRSRYPKAEWKVGGTLPEDRSGYFGWAVVIDQGDPVGLFPVHREDDVTQTIRDDPKSGPRNLEAGEVEAADEGDETMLSVGEFVAASDGSADFGSIGEELARFLGVEPGPIRIYRGRLKHFTKKRPHRLDEIRRQGYPSARAFVEDVARNFTAVYQGTRGSFILVKRNGPGQMIYIELVKEEGEGFYSVRTGVPRPRSDYFDKRTPLWEGAQTLQPPSGGPTALSVGRSSVGNIIAPGEEVVKGANLDQPPLSRRQAGEIKALVEDVRGWLAEALDPEVLERVDVELKPVISLAGKNAARSLAEHGDIPISNILGATTFRRLEALVELAYGLDRRTLQGTAYHEAFHVAARWLLPAKEYARLVKFHGSEEKAANAFSAYAMRRKASAMQGGPTGMIRRIMAKLARILRIVKNGLQGKGFTRPEDVFGRILAKDYRPHWAAPVVDPETTTAFNVHPRQMSIPVARISGEEIKDIESKPSGLEYFREHLKGEHHNDYTGWDIRISREGVDHIYNQARSEDDIRALAALPQLLRNAILYMENIEPKPESDDPRIGHKFLAPLLIGDTWYRAEIMVKEAFETGREYGVEGLKIHKLYSQNLKQIKRPVALTMPLESGEGPDSTERPGPRPVAFAAPLEPGEGSNSPERPGLEISVEELF